MFVFPVVGCHRNPGFSGEGILIGLRLRRENGGLFDVIVINRKIVTFDMGAGTSL